jgi:hypothetical protein
MSIDTLAYAKELEAAGVERRAAEAHAEALTKHVLPDLGTKADLTAMKTELEGAIDRLEQRLRTAMEQTAHQQTVRVSGIVFAIVGLLDAILFALLRVVH